ncbi:MAG: FtsW/RodA/SpoVE family cell cycle protein [Verrucomicrobiales bacterium]|nr:FtsW/RodA/SpoVE family cell cycle protein [Verrucomicrobiales bacterium]
MARRSGLLLLTCVTLLIGLGFVMLVSTNFYVDPAKGGGESYANVWGQARYLGVGLVLLTLFACLDYNALLRWSIPLFILGLISMLLCKVPGIGVASHGAARWIRVFGISGQPSEFARIAFIILAAVIAARITTASAGQGWRSPFAHSMLLLAAMLGAFFVQEDLGNAAITGVLAFTLLFVAGEKLWKLLLCGAVFAALGITAVIHNPNRMKRLVAIEDLKGNATDLGMQQTVSQLAFGSGGIQGRGLGEGRMKLSYLPESHTDFIFPMLGEELGFLGTSATVLIYILLLLSGMCIAAYAPNRFGKILGLGLSALIACGALVNMGVATSLLPNKGLPLPFVSHGGSSLVAACIAVGILVNIHRQGVLITRDQLPVLRRNRRWTPQL